MHHVMKSHESTLFLANFASSGSKVVKQDQWKGLVITRSIRDETILLLTNWYFLNYYFVIRIEYNEKYIHWHLSSMVPKMSGAWPIFDMITSTVLVLKSWAYLASCWLGQDEIKTLATDKSMQNQNPTYVYIYIYIYIYIHTEYVILLYQWWW